jgi:hypothetical protein
MQIRVTRCTCIHRLAKLGKNQSAMPRLNQIRAFKQFIRLSYVDAAARFMRFKIYTDTSNFHGYVIVSAGIRFNEIQSFSATYQDASFKVATNSNTYWSAKLHMCLDTGTPLAVKLSSL